ncbi:response regulator [Xanthobacter pseudotagetidis]|uniref:response regulator n=1 Tax=Xanthobacter pseudotagetidis TaxID=3119911 RepID=UPI00372AFEEE
MMYHASSILIAEDSPTQQAQLVQFLEKLGYAVKAARSGTEAYEMAVAQRPDIILSDIIMPGMSGYDLCRRLKGTAGLDQVPVILVTSLSQPQDVLAGLEAGADSFIIKPYDEQILSSRITYLLRNRTLRSSESVSDVLEIEFGGERHHVTARKQQILDLLISTYAQAVHLFTALDQGRQELSQSYEVLHALYDMTEGLNRCRAPADVAAVAVSRSLGVPGVRDAWLYLREGDALVLAADRHFGHGALADPFPPEPPADADEEVPVDEGARSGGLPQIRQFQARGTGALRHHASMRLTAGARTIGCLQLAGSESAISGEVALRTLEGIAGQIAIALERALLHTQLEEEVRKRTERLLEEVAERRQATETITAIFNASPVSLISLDARLNVATLNHSARDAFRISGEGALGRGWRSLFATVPPGLEEAIGALPRGREVISIEVEAAISDGTQRTFHIAGEPLIDADGAFRGAVLAADDITERRQVMEQLHQAQKMEAVGTLTGGVAHDFNNLLTTIIGNLDLAAIKLDGHEARPLLDVALRSSLRGAELTRKMLTFARKQPLEPRYLDVAEMMAELQILLGATFGQSVSLAITVPPGLPKVYADPTHLESALMNLAINARDAMPDGGRLSIAAEATPGGAANPGGPRNIVFVVSDTGTGIASDRLERIFEPFFTTKEAGKGTGLGLAMVYGFARQSGGSVEVESVVGMGTTFRVTLPAVEDGPGEAPVPDAPAVSGPEPTAKAVLLVEGNDEIRQTIRAALERSGHLVSGVSDAGEALEHFDTGGHFDLLLTEVSLPGDIDGLRLAGLVAQRRPDCQVLLMSGAIDLQLEDEARRSFRILSKPFRIDDLTRAVSALF